MAKPQAQITSVYVENSKRNPEVRLPHATRLGHVARDCQSKPTHPSQPKSDKSGADTVEILPPIIVPVKVNDQDIEMELATGTMLSRGGSTGSLYRIHPTSVN